MDHVADPLDGITVAECSPDHMVSGTLARQGQITFEFRSAAYRMYDESTLGHQLGELLTRLWGSFRHAYYRAMSEALGETITGDEPEESPKLARYQHELAALPVQGDSPHRWVRLRSDGLRRWRVTVRNGALSQLTEHELLAEVDGALQALFADHQSKLVALKDEHFDLRLPPEQRAESRRNP